ncbi:MAG: ABC transporter permease [Vicinamibacterales bacterium]
MNDIRLAFRLCRRHPVMSLAAVLSLALGIGANTAIFTVLNGSILRPLPYQDPDRLMVVWETTTGNSRRSVAPGNFIDWRAAGSFEGLAAFDEFAATHTGHGEPERLRAVSASANFFELLGVRAAVGRVTTASEDRAGAEPVAVLSDGLWHRLFAASPGAVGQPLILNGITYTIAGVLPEDFSMPMAAGVEVWVTGDRGVPRSVLTPGDITSIRDSHYISVVGRLAPGASRERAQAELTSVMTDLSARYPNTNAGLGVSVMPLHEEIVGNVRPLVLLLQIAVALLLLIACANVAHLLLGQAAGRRAEMSLRIALGAERGRLVRQLLAETLVVAVPGGVLGLALAAAGIRTLVAAAPATLPRLGEIALDGTVLLFTLGMTLATALVFGLGPALQAAGTSANALAQIGQRLTGSRGVRRWHQAIVVIELALAQMLLVGAGLLLVSFVQATRIDLGFASEGRLAAELSLAPDRYLASVDAEGRIDPARKIRFINDVIDRLSGRPGIRAVAASFTAPLTGAPNRGMRIEGDPVPQANDQSNGDFQLVTPDYFRAMGITLVAGRAFSTADRANTAPVVIINRALADRYFKGRDPIGRVLLFGGSRRHEIVGVAANARYRSIERPADATFYVPLEQNDERWPSVSFVVWADASSAGGPAAALREWRAGASAPAAVLREEIHGADPLQPISRIRSFDDILSQSMAPRRFNTWLVGVFAATALLLAAIGTYGVMAFAVASRTKELGLRAALGASPRDLVGMVLGQGLTLTMAATVLGLGAATLVTRFMASMLFGIAPRDPWTFVAVAGLLTSVAIAATLLPARRAMRVNPVTALKDA